MTAKRTKFDRRRSRRTQAAEQRTAYQGANVSHQDLATWTPANYSAQSALTYERNMLTARIHDIERNDGWASAAMDTLVNNVIGSGWKLLHKPNHVSLGISPEAANEFAAEVEAAWEDYAQDPAMYCDAGRRMNDGQIDALAFRHRVMDGEALGVLLWLPRGGTYSTAIQVIDPDRLSQPDGAEETAEFRDGVEMDATGAPIAYHIAKRHPSDNVFSRGAFLDEWERVDRETPWGRAQVVHSFDARRAGQIRGAPPLAPILRKLKQITRYDEAELQAAVLNAVMAAFVESPMDHENLAESLAAGDVDPYQEARLDYYAASPLRVQGAQVSFLYPGERVTLTDPQHPNSTYESFIRGSLRNIAAATGITYEQLTSDYSQVNYSSARAALLEVWRGMNAKKRGFAAQWKTPWFAAWMEEAIEIGTISLPSGGPDFNDAKAAYCRAEWIGPARGWVDPAKEADAAATRIDAGLSNMQRECYEQGCDWKEVADQQKRERDYYESIGLEYRAELRPTQSRDFPGEEETFDEEVDEG